MINLERWTEIKAVVQKALDLPSEERSTYLDQVCGGDEQLRQEVEALLAVSSTHAEIIDNYQVLPPSVRRADLKEGDEVGAYRIISPLGEGGMGAVYLAHDTRHDRRVALKTVPRRSENSLREEQRLLAKLQHPNIAALYDSGVTPDGFGYFIMEYIEGDPITTYCDTHKLSIRERLELFLPVCDAVSTAHRDLIVHRDIKPSNILVTKDGTPKLLDFGIAKLLSPVPGLQPEALSFTAPFASPEQLEGDYTSTATDVYSLGVLLCLLLTGRLPYPVKSYGDLPWAIRNMEPEKPSQLILKEDVGLDANARPAPVPPADSQKLARSLRGDLDAIVLRALQKDAEKRYQSVEQFAEDIRRALSDRPVSARNSTRRYRVNKFIQRHLWIIIATTLTFCALVTLSAFLFRETREANRQRDLANQQAQHAEEVTQFLIQLFDRTSPWSKTGPAQTPEQLVDTAALRLQHSNLSNPQLRGRLLIVLADIHTRLGSYEKAEPLLHTAMMLYPSSEYANNIEVGQIKNALGALRQYQGRFKEAESLYNQALPIFRHHASEDLEPLVSCLNNLSSLKIRQGEMTSAERLARESLALCDAHPRQVGDRRDTALRLLSNSLQNQDRLDEAEVLSTKVLELRKKEYGPQHPSTAMAIEDLATIAHDKGDHAKEGRLHREAVEMMVGVVPEDNPQLLTAMDNLAGALSHLGRSKEAEALHREILAQRRRVLGNAHPLVGFSINNLASIIAQDNQRLAEAADLLRQALPILKATHGPESREVSICLDNLAAVLTRLGKYNEADAIYRESLSIAIRAFGEDSIDTALTQKSYGSLKLKQKRYVEARELLEHSLQVLRAKNSSNERDIAYVEVLLGASLAGLQEFEAAERLMIPAFEVMQQKEPRKRRNIEAVNYLVQLYATWSKPDKASQYRRLLEELEATK